MLLQIRFFNLLHYHVITTHPNARQIYESQMTRICCPHMAVDVNAVFNNSIECPRAVPNLIIKQIIFICTC